MQCANCEFQNMPGTDVCGRCGTSLRLATATIDVNPPRAGRVVKRLRRGVPVRRMFYGLRDAADAVGATPAVRHLGAAFPFGLFARLVVPGWSHFYLGLRVRGHLFLWCFLACLLPGLLLMGTFWSAVLLGLAFSVHSTAALDVVMRTFADAGMRDRIARSVVVSLVLGALVYVPAGWLLTSVADPLTVAMSQGPFASREVVLVNHWATPRPGDVVVYDIPPYDTGPIRRGRNVVYGPQRVDRVLAGPGDRVSWERGRVIVNGAASHLLPLDPARLPPRVAEMMVPAGCLLILPSTTPDLGPVHGPADLVTMSLVPLENVRGRVWARSQPLSRLWWVR